MRYLYATKSNLPPRLVATFGGEAQLLAYVRWATIKSSGEQRGKFEQGSVLAGYDAWQASAVPLSNEDATEVIHAPSPNML